MLRRLQQGAAAAPADAGGSLSGWLQPGWALLNMERSVPLRAARWHLAAWLPILLVAAGAAAAWAGCRLWRWRRQRAQQRAQHRRDLQSLLAAQQRQASSTAEQLADGAALDGVAGTAGLAEPGPGCCEGRSGGSGQRGSGGTRAASPAAEAAAAARAAAGASPPRPGGHCAESRGRRARLAALIATHLGPRHTRSLGHLPRDALPAALTHQMARTVSAPEGQQKRRRRHHQRKPGAEGAGGWPARGSPEGPSHHRAPAREELQLAMQQLQQPGDSQQRSPARAGKRPPHTRPPPGTPSAAACGAGAAGAQAPPSTPLAAASGSGFPASSPHSQSSGSAPSSGSGFSGPSRGIRGGTDVGGSGGSSMERIGSGSGRGSVLEWLSSSELRAEADEPQPDRPLAGLQFAAGGGSHGLAELGAGPHGVTYRGWLASRDVAIKVRWRAAQQAQRASAPRALRSAPRRAHCPRRRRLGPARRVRRLSRRLALPARRLWS